MARTGRWTLVSRLLVLAAIYSLPLFPVNVMANKVASAALAFLMVPSLMFTLFLRHPISAAHLLHDFAVCELAHRLLPLNVVMALVHALAALSTVRSDVPQRAYRYCVVAVYSLAEPPYGPAMVFLYFLLLM